METEKNYQEKKEYTDNFLTKQGKMILIHILMFPGICSSDLAKKLDVRKNSMSNALDRLKGSKYALIESKAKGRNKFYYLTEWGEKYTKAYLCPLDDTEKQQDVFQINSSNDDEYDAVEFDRQKAEEYIVDLEKINPEWQYLLYSFLVSGNECGDEEINYLMLELLKTIQRLFGVKNQSDYTKIIEKIHSTIVSEQIEQWLKRQKELEPLWDWAAESWIEAYEFIDEIFDGNKSLVGYDFGKEIKNDFLLSHELGQVVIELRQFVGEARIKEDTKTKFYYEFIKKYPRCNEQLAFYISEKYRILMREMRK